MGDLIITAAKLAERDGQLLPFIEIDGCWYSMETEERLLKDRLVALSPVTADLQPSCDGPTTCSGKKSGAGSREKWQGPEVFCATTHPKVLALARKAAELLASGQAEAGSIL